MPPETQTCVCDRCHARGQLEPWGEQGMLPFGWHHTGHEEPQPGILCPECWKGWMAGLIETAKAALSRTSTQKRQRRRTSQS